MKEPHTAFEPLSIYVIVKFLSVLVISALFEWSFICFLSLFVVILCHLPVTFISWAH